jgi:coproporphyrinogen III oxidase-like Fe-S oxidoreductase
VTSLVERIATNDRERKALLERGDDGGLLRRSVSAEDALSLIGGEVDRAATKDLLLYLHVPFCSSKCLFCDWVADVPVTQLRGGSEMRRRYVASLVKQIRYLGPRLSEMAYTPRHLYWGGGTPSKLEVDDFEEVGGALAESFNLALIDEHTIEVSPETLTPPKLHAMRRGGMNRLSLGVQSLDDEELRRSGRSHSSRQVEEAVELVRAAGFTNWNLDVILGLPGQSPEMLERTLSMVVKMEPPHVTTYLYRATPQTVMADQMNRGYRETVRFQKLYKAHGLAQRMLEAAGFHEYSLGYFTRQEESRFKGEAYYYGFQGEYVGFGSGAGSILGHHYFKNASDDLRRFMDDPLRFDYCVKVSAARVDLLADSLRVAMLTEGGINVRNFERLFGFQFAELREQPTFAAYLRAYRECGAVFIESPERLAITPATWIWLLLIP